jgi:hypothetical protein
MAGRQRRHVSAMWVGLRHSLGAVGILASGRAPFYRPPVATPGQDVWHLHAFTRVRASLGTEENGRVGFVLPERHSRDGNIHRVKIRPLREVLKYRLPNCFLVINVLAAAAQGY